MYCFCFKHYYDIDLFKRYYNFTEPCIIKFEFKGGNPSHLGNLLFYLYSLQHSEMISSYSNACYDAQENDYQARNDKGIRISKLEILNLPNRRHKG